MDSSRNIDIRDRFFQEAQIIARLKHPNIVPIMDVSEYLGRPYYIMSYINGGSLYNLLNKDGKVSIEQSIEIVIKLLSALSEIHGKGIIHRDIKPENVLLDDSGEPILIDFGIARVEEGHKARTGTGIAIGTPAYMSPEQLDGNMVTPQTDLYSIGILLFELITGNPPFEGNLSSIIKQQHSGEIPSISEGNSKKNNLINDIDKIIKKACAKDLNIRFVTANQMKETLENLSFKLSEERINEFLGSNQNENQSNLINKNSNSIYSNIKKYIFLYLIKNLRRVIFLFSIAIFTIILIYFQFKSSLHSNKEQTNINTNIIDNSELNKVIEKPLKESDKNNLYSESTFINSIGMDFVLIPAGEFMMGCSKNDNECLKNEKPPHEMIISSSFYIGKYEVTQREWTKVMSTNPSNNLNCGENCPVESVSWLDIQTYINNLCELEKMKSCKYRLPTEAEWEYVARGDSIKRYYWGNSLKEDYLWFDENSEGNIHPIGLKKPNFFGVYDISGNVWEWVNDDYTNNYKAKLDMDVSNADMIKNKKVLRGCSSLNSIKYCRVSYRYSDNPNTKNKLIGLRLVYIP